MEQLEVALSALVIAAIALWLSLGARNQNGRLRREFGALRREVEALRTDLGVSRAALESTRADLDRAQREVGELKAATDAAAVPPLPRGRSAHLDDLREQLRAAHREGDDASEE